MTPYEKLEGAMVAGGLTEAERGTVWFALGVVCTADPALIAIGEKKGRVPYQNIARDLVGPEWKLHAPNSNN